MTMAIEVFDDVGQFPCTEFEIQAFLWRELRQRGFRVRGEYPFWDGAGRCRRADLAVWVQGMGCPFAIEVKADGRPVTPAQLNRYRMAQCDFAGVLGICGRRHAMKFLAVIDRYDQPTLAAELQLTGVKQLARLSKVMAK